MGATRVIMECDDFCCRRRSFCMVGRKYQCLEEGYIRVVHMHLVASCSQL
jgi:hypothetical protein